MIAGSMLEIQLNIKSSKNFFFYRSINNNPFLNNQWKCQYKPNVNLLIFAMTTFPLILHWRTRRSSAEGHHPKVGWEGRLKAEKGRLFEGYSGKVGPSQRARELKVLRWGRSPRLLHLQYCTLYFDKKKYQHCATLKSGAMCYSYCENYFCCIGYHQVGNINPLA